MLRTIDEPCSTQKPISAEATEQYADIVHRLAIGDDPRFEEVCLVLAAAGKTAAGLARDVAAQQSRKE